MSVAQGLELIQRSRKWYEKERSLDKLWAAKVTQARGIVRDPSQRGLEIPDFPTFCDEYLGMKLWPHQLNMIDVLEGRPPRWLHPGMTYEPGASGKRRILINIPRSEERRVGQESRSMGPR